MWNLLANAASTWAMVGLIWLIQLVHYPLMVHVNQGFQAFHGAHSSRIALIVGPLMGIEALTSLVLTARRPEGIPDWVAWCGVILVGVSWAATALFSIPMHMRLSSGTDQKALDMLVATNWIRTVAWTAHGLLALWMLKLAFDQAQAT